MSSTHFRMFDVIHVSMMSWGTSSSLSRGMYVVLLCVESFTVGLVGIYM